MALIIEIFGGVVLGMIGCAAAAVLSCGILACIIGGITYIIDWIRSR